MNALRTSLNFIKREAKLAAKAAKLSWSSQISANKIEKIKKSVVGLCTDAGEEVLHYASGVIFKEDKENYYVLTAAHAINKPKSILVAVGQNYLEAKGVIYHPEKLFYDIGLVKISKEGINPHDVNIISLAEPSDHKPIFDFPVIILGCRFLCQTDYEETFPQIEINIVRGEASQPRPKEGPLVIEGLLVIKGMVEEGFSGGPVVDMKGKLVGIMFAALTFTSLATPINVIKKFVKESLFKI